MPRIALSAVNRHQMAGGRLSPEYQGDVGREQADKGGVTEMRKVSKDFQRRNLVCFK